MKNGNKKIHVIGNIVNIGKKSITINDIQMDGRLSSLSVMKVRVKDIRKLSYVYYD